MIFLHLQAEWPKNSVDADQLASQKPADLDLQCFQNSPSMIKVNLFRTVFVDIHLIKIFSHQDLQCFQNSPSMIKVNLIRTLFVDIHLIKIFSFF